MPPRDQRMTARAYDELEEPVSGALKWLTILWA
jgi:hypothetical protein